MRKTYMYNGGRCSKKRILESVSQEDFEAFEKEADKYIEESGKNYYGGLIDATLRNGEKCKLYLEIRKGS